MDSYRRQVNILLWITIGLLALASAIGWAVVVSNGIPAADAALFFGIGVSVFPAAIVTGFAKRTTGRFLLIWGAGYLTIWLAVVAWTQL